VCSDRKKDIYAFESTNKNATLQMLVHLASAGFINKDGCIDLPLHPSHRISEELDDIAQRRSIEKKDFLMVCNLSSTKLDGVYKKIQNNQDSLGTFWTPRDPWTS